jgi:hypothetical protein
MRVSKVKVPVENGHEEMVLMKRSNEKGMLVYSSSDSEGGTPRTDEIIPKKKKDSFRLSITNKTLAKPKKENDEYKALRALIEGEHPNWYDLRGINKERPTKEYLNPRFQGTFKYIIDDRGTKIEFNLAELIIKAKSQQSLSPMAKYYNWKDWFIKTKGDALKKSIKNNRIQLDAEEDSLLSHRKQALRQWTKEFSDKGELDLTAIQGTYHFDGLMAKLKEPKLQEEEKNGKKYKKYNEYHCALKKALQAHQKEIFGSREAPNKENRENVQLYVYNMEVAKYLEHYFPVKKSARRNTEDDNEHYLQPGTIKRTVTHQIENAVRLDRIQQGKFEHHECDKPEAISSKRLTEIKADEAFALHLSELCTFAANNIRNMVDKEQTKDVLGKDDFQASLKKNTFNKNLFKFFYDKADPSSDDTYTLRSPDDNDKWAMQQAVAQIRHKVVHYRKEALEKIFAIDSFNGSSKYTDTIFKQCLENDKKKLPEYFAEQLKTGKVLDYYPMKELQNFLSNHQFKLYRSVVPFAPGFKSVMETGRNHQYADGKAIFYDLELRCYLEKKDKYVESGGDGEAYEARYFLMKLVYNNMFLPEFTEDNPQLFRCSVRFVLDRNQEQADEQARRKAKSKGRRDWQSQRAKAWAFRDVPPMKTETSVHKYMAEVQSSLMLEYNKKKEELEQQAKHPGDDEEVRQNFKKFLLQVFAKGFDDYIRDNHLDFILHPQKEEGHPNDKEDAIVESCRGAVSSDTINVSDNSHIAFYTFCKLLDANHLSTLRNELIKYRSTTEEEKMAQDNIKKTQQLLAIVELCLFSADAVLLPDSKKEKKSEAEKNKELDTYADYIEKDVAYKDWPIYNQQSESEEDKVTPVIHRTIALSHNYGTETLLKAVIRQKPEFLIAQDEYEEWENLKKKVESKDGAGVQRVQLHKQWVEAQNNDKSIKVAKERHFVTDFMAQNQGEYKNLCDTIDRYDWLDNKLKFEHLRRLHNLTIEILARLCGFVTLWERDFRYLYINAKAKDWVTEELDFSKGMPKPWKMKEEEDKKFYLRTFGYSGENRDIRNHIAHFNYLTTAAGECSLIELINNVRKMLFYDRKLKNAVNKAMIKLFDKHGMELKFKRNADDTFSIAELKAKSIYHLGTKGKRKEAEQVKTPQVTGDFCEMCRVLLEFKNEG